MPSWRSIAMPEWDEIAPNYTASTRAAVDELMDSFRTAHGERLVLWRSDARHGKTFALRALARGIGATGCSIHYVVDPDTFAVLPPITR